MGGDTPSDTVLVRGNYTVGAIMIPSSASITNVTIAYLTFDGNRYGVTGLNCLAGNNSNSDLDLDFGGLAQGTFTVEWADFINAPGDALKLGGASTVSLSNFGQGGAGIGANGSYQAMEPAIQSATRSTAVWVEGSGNGAWYNAIAYAGTAAISLNGSYQFAAGNLLQQNRYEMSDTNPDGSVNPGGQLAVNPGSSYATVAGNVIIGNFWPYVAGGTQLATNCYLGTGSGNNSGIEGYGLGHGFYNNEVEQNLGSGMSFPEIPGAGTGQITISSSNPLQSDDSPRYIEANAEGGIVFVGPNTNPLDPQNYPGPVMGVLLDDVLVRGNALTAVVLDSVQNASVGGYSGFTSNACLSVPSGYGYLTTSPASWTSLSSKTPSSYTTYTGASGPTCPPTSWSFQIPAPSHTPGWSW